MMFTASFWKATAERVIATFAQALVGVLSADGLGIIDVNWPDALSIAALAAVLALLKALAASQIGNVGPSLANEVISPPAPRIEDDRGQSTLLLVLAVVGIVLLVLLVLGVL